ncbi:MAG TPA: cupin domain-containing protein [bacterium]|nr:cupin domain-containing protein [bacterium]
MAPSRHPHIVNVNDLEWIVTEHGRFGAERKAFTAPAGGRQLGFSLYRVPPGKSAFPAHLHHANEEAIYVLSGSGTLRLGEQRHPVGPGDYIALPAGPPAHQLLNTGVAPLEYLCVSTMIHPEVSEYPDSGKFGVMTDSAPGGDKAQRRLSGFYKTADAVDYYEGEDD